jgi:hypothetical protein
VPTGRGRTLASWSFNISWSYYSSKNCFRQSYYWSLIISSGPSWEKNNILKKLSNHEKRGMLAVSKLNTINDLVSKALNDSHISTDELALITKEK